MAALDWDVPSFRSCNAQQGCYRRASQLIVHIIERPSAHCATRLGGSTMNHQRRRFLHLAAGAAALPAVPRIATAQTYLSRPVRIAHQVDFMPIADVNDV